ncbi:MAG TPA: tetratricopeptide repeat protein, partial [Chthoniobacterales bacterium]
MSRFRVPPVVLVLALLLALDPSSPTANAQTPAPLAAAAQPLSDGVPQVAVVRLRAVLAGKLSDDDRRAATVKLGEALIAAEQPDEALKILSDARLPDSVETRFLKAQGLAALARWTDALPLYQQVAADPATPLRPDALLGQAEALRALNRTDEALQTLAGLTNDRRWGSRARFLSAELLLAKKDIAGAARTVDSVEPASAAERKMRRFLRGRIEWEANQSEKAIEMFASILRNPEGAPHSTLIAALFAIADAHLQMKTPGAGDDFLEGFIDRYPTDPDLPLVFAKLEQLYAAERKQGRHELPRWSTDPAQPRRALAQWYLARAELRMGNREVALQILEELRAAHPPLPALAEAFLSSAELALDAGQLDRAFEALDAARALQPSAALLERIEFLSARAQYSAQRFDGAAEAFRKLARVRTSAAANDALYNASLAWLQAGDPAQAAAANHDLKQRGADAQTQGDLALEQGLIEAARGGNAAGEALQKFLQQFPA